MRTVRVLIPITLDIEDDEVAHEDIVLHAYNVLCDYVSENNVDADDIANCTVEEVE